MTTLLSIQREGGKELELGILACNSVGNSGGRSNLNECIHRYSIILVKDYTSPINPIRWGRFIQDVYTSIYLFSLFILTKYFDENKFILLFIVYMNQAVVSYIQVKCSLA